MIQKALLTQGPIGAKVSRNGNDPKTSLTKWEWSKNVTDAGPEQPFRCLDVLLQGSSIGQNHHWPSHLNFVNLGKNIQWWCSGWSKTIEKPSKAMVLCKKNITIPSFGKNDHRDQCGKIVRKIIRVWGWFLTKLCSWTLLLESLWLAFCKLERGGTNVSQHVFAALYPHFITSLPFINTFACDIILLPFSFLNKSEYGQLGRKVGNYLSGCLNCEKIFEKHGQPNRRLSPQASAGFEAAAKTVCKILNFFEV